MIPDNCTLCPLHKERTNIVIGTGDLHAAIMFVGEAPGEQEDLKGEPFVGPAGKLLDKLLHKAGLKRKDVFITNVVKCRPPGNREPTPEEIHMCSPFLRKQIQAIQPRVLVTLGRVATQRLTFQFGAMGDLLSNPNLTYTYREDAPIPVLALYHPSYLLRQGAALRGKAKPLFLDAVARLKRATEYQQVG